MLLGTVSVSLDVISEALVCSGSEQAPILDRATGKKYCQRGPD